MARSDRDDDGLALLAPAERNQERRAAHRATRAGGDPHRSRAYRRRLSARAPRAHDGEHAGAVQAPGLEVRLREPVQGRRSLREHAAVRRQKWGTTNPVIVRDAQLGPVRLRAYGTYAMRLVD